MFAVAAFLRLTDITLGMRMTHRHYAGISNASAWFWRHLYINGFGRESDQWTHKWADDALIECGHNHVRRLFAVTWPKGQIRGSVYAHLFFEIRVHQRRTGEATLNTIRSACKCFGTCLESGWRRRRRADGHQWVLYCLAFDFTQTQGNWVAANSSTITKSKHFVTWSFLRILSKFSMKCFYEIRVYFISKVVLFKSLYTKHCFKFLSF